MRSSSCKTFIYGDPFSLSVGLASMLQLSAHGDQQMRVDLQKLTTSDMCYSLGYALGIGKLKVEADTLLVCIVIHKVLQGIDSIARIAADAGIWPLL